MVHRVQAGLVMTLLAAVTLAGCFGGEASVDRVEEQRDPNWRVRDLEMRTEQQSNCHHKPLMGDQCIEPMLDFTEVKCDPHQRVLVEHGFGSRHDEWDGPEDVYLYCMYTMEWSFKVNSPFPFTTAHVWIRYDDEKIWDSCNTGMDKTCAVTGQVKGTIQFHQAYENEKVGASMGGSIQPYPPALHSYVGRGSGNAEAELTLYT